jgi:hypothetical protein
MTVLREVFIVGHFLTKCGQNDGVGTDDDGRKHEATKARRTTKIAAKEREKHVGMDGCGRLREWRGDGMSWARMGSLAKNGFPLSI